MNRILTIQVEIIDKDDASWIWDSHMNDYSEHGVHITAIQEGPIPKERDEE